MDENIGIYRLHCGCIVKVNNTYNVEHDGFHWWDIKTCYGHSRNLKCEEIYCHDHPANHEYSQLNKLEAAIATLQGNEAIPREGD